VLLHHASAFSTSYLSSDCSRGRLQGKAAKKGKTAAAEEKPTGGDGDGDDEKPAYVHVRARRGQATDSHSLAERVSSASPRR
jgi:hypothetical protein